MKLGLLVASVALVASAGSALAAGPYVGVDAGVSINHESDVKFPGGSDKVKYKTGYGVDIRGGYSFDQFRAEGELGYRTNEIKDSDGNDVKAMSFMVNGFYDVKLNGQVTPFVGVGLGMINAKVDGDKDTKPAYSLALGASMPVNKNLNFDLTYKFTSIFSDFDFDGAKVSMSNSSLLLGARYNF